MKIKCNLCKKKQKTILTVLFFLSFVILGQKQLKAQSYIQTRLGMGWGRYAPINKEELDRNEHDFKLGTIFDVEFGQKIGLKGSNEKFALLIGARLHYNLRLLEGNYTSETWEPEANINTHIFGFYVTPGVIMKISDRFNMFLQTNIGPSFVLWFQDGVFTNSFWKFYIPIDIGGEYKLKDDLNLTFGINVQLPIYYSTAETLFLGIKKVF